MVSSVAILESRKKARILDDEVQFSSVKSCGGAGPVFWLAMGEVVCGARLVHISIQVVDRCGEIDSHSVSPDA